MFKNSGSTIRGSNTVLGDNTKMHPDSVITLPAEEKIEIRGKQKFVYISQIKKCFEKFKTEKYEMFSIDQRKLEGWGNIVGELEGKC